MERKKVNSKGAIAAVLKYFELCLHVTVLLCKGEVGNVCKRATGKEKKTIRKRSMLD